MQYENDVKMLVWFHLYTFEHWQLQDLLKKHSTLPQSHKNRNTKVWSNQCWSHCDAMRLKRHLTKRSHAMLLRQAFFVSLRANPPMGLTSTWKPIFVILYHCSVNMFSICFNQKSNIPDLFRWKCQVIPAQQQNSTDEMLMPWNLLCCLYDDAECACSQCLAAITKVYVNFCHSYKIASSAWSPVKTCGDGWDFFIFIIFLFFFLRPPDEERPQLIRLLIFGAWLELWTTHCVEPASWRKKGLPGWGGNNPPKVVNEWLIVKRPAPGHFENKITPLMSIAAAVYQRPHLWWSGRRRLPLSQRGSPPGRRRSPDRPPTPS